MNLNIYQDVHVGSDSIIGSSTRATAPSKKRKKRLPVLNAGLVLGEESHIFFGTGVVLAAFEIQLEVSSVN